MKSIVLVQVDAVIARPYPIAIAINQAHVQRKKPEQTIDVTNRLEFFRQILHGRLIQHPTKLHQLLRRLLTTRFQFVRMSVVRQIVAAIIQAATAPG